MGAAFRWFREDGAQMGSAILAAVPPPTDVRGDQHTRAGSAGLRRWVTFRCQTRGVIPTPPRLRRAVTQ
eukprot:9128296-Lingulodinium_polyedra.AAC.1